MIAFLCAVIILVVFVVVLHVFLAEVTSYSMFPTLTRGGLLVVLGSIGHQRYRVGGVVVYRSTDPSLNYELIVHRIVGVDVNPTGGIVGLYNT